ncbi:predicted protein [Lichtheimia corymbifera JMRC:FSU:9682]|uniref:Uncharacterized protein n=1 Tax=Lichtheimia corymbifera JMRC:FSU:9682 TaxID=1263082 RepID=A0A068SG72_9FUNG|nr:predicted protein [Lichtheimia corymbifera JMRC:FSU:9682]
MAFSAQNHNSTQAGTPPLGNVSDNPSSPNTSNTTNSNSTTPSPFDFWQDFTNHAKSVRARKEVVLEDKAAKEAANRQRQERIFVRSIESDSAVFDISKASDSSTSDFFGALTRQHPKAIGWTPSKLSPSCVIVSFEDAEARDAACLGVKVGECDCCVHRYFLQ